MHPVVHEWARTRLGEVARQDAWEQALDLRSLVHLIKLCSLQPVGSGLTVRSFQDEIDLLESLHERDLQTPGMNDHMIQELLSKRAQAYESLGNNERAINLLIEELEVVKRASPPGTPAVRDVLYRLSELYLTVGQAEKIVTLLEDAFKLDSKQDPPDHTWFWTTTSLVKAYLHLEKYDQAMPILEEMHLQYSRMNPEDKFARADIMHKLAIAYLGTEEPSRAVPLLEEVIELNRLWLPLSSLQLHAAIKRLATAFIETDNRSQAAPLFEEVVKFEKSSLPPDEAGLLGSMINLALVYFNLNKPDQTVLLLDEVVEIQRSSLAPDDPERLAPLVLLGKAYLKLMQSSEARGLLQEVVEIERSSVPSDDTDRLATLYLLAQAHINLKQPGLALEYLEELVKCRRSSLPLNDEDLVFSIELLAKNYLNLDRPSQAVTLLEDVVKDPLTHSSEGHSIRVKILADAYFMLDKPDHAVTLLEELVESLPADNSERPSSADRLANAYVKVGKPSQAVTLLEKLVEGLSEDDTGRLFSINSLAYTYIRLDKPDQTVTLLEEHIKGLPEDYSGRLFDINLLAEAYLMLGKPDQTVALLEELVESLLADTAGRPHSTSLLAEAYLRLGKPSQTQTLQIGWLVVALLEEAVKSLPDDFPEEVVPIMELLAKAFKELGRPKQAVPLLERIVAWDRGHLAEDDVGRLVTMSNLAQAYTKLGTCEKVKEAVLLLEEVIEKGQDTLHANPEDLKFTQEKLAEAQEKLRQISGEQLPVDLTKRQESVDITADKLTDSTVYQHLRNLTKRAHFQRPLETYIALTGLFDGLSRTSAAKDSWPDYGKDGVSMTLAGGDTRQYTYAQKQATIVLALLLLRREEGTSVCIWTVEHDACNFGFYIAPTAGKLHSIITTWAYDTTDDRRVLKNLLYNWLHSFPRLTLSADLATIASCRRPGHPPATTVDIEIQDNGDIRPR
ncbi:hypothetical protein KCU62_g479, partial [Aureobasidium sp. EXF-3399]